MTYLLQQKTCTVLNKKKDDLKQVCKNKSNFLHSLLQNVRIIFSFGQHYDACFQIFIQLQQDLTDTVLTCHSSRGMTTICTHIVHDHFWAQNFWVL